ncbi:MAG: DNA replication and repair protein RecF [Sphingobacteriales bacterium]|nr:MAG: DNA replication and repair protein RecF [Sphingobacteriales bacterium]
MQKGLDGFRVEGVFDHNGNNETISCKWKQGKKEIFQNQVEYDKLTDHIGRYAAVMVAPDDIELINEGSELRRKWVDSILGQTDREYLERLMRYQRVLQQRNAWLKMQNNIAPTNSAELDYYDARLAEDGTYIHGLRRVFTTAFLPLLNDYYHKLSGGRELIDMQYASDLDQKNLHDWLKASLQNDLRMQRTTKGIHKDDCAFMLNDNVLKQFASQGQKKSFLFALKLAQYTYLSKQLGYLPMLLLDDVFEKLDQQRIEALLGIIRAEDFGQVIITDTHAERVAKAFDGDEEIGFIHLAD